MRLKLYFKSIFKEDMCSKVENILMAGCSCVQCVGKLHSYINEYEKDLFYQISGYTYLVN